MASIREQILELMDSGPKSMSELYEGVRGKRASIDKARQRLLKQGKIERVDHGVYQKSAPSVVNFNFSEMSDEDITNYELNSIGDIIDQMCEVVDKINPKLEMEERLEILQGLLESAAGFIVEAGRVYQMLHAKAEADFQDPVFAEKLAEKYKDSERDFTASGMPLKALVNLLLFYKEDT